jgi:hypothetical protein
MISEMNLEVATATLKNGVLEVVMKKGWNLPFEIKMYIKHLQKTHIKSIKKLFTELVSNAEKKDAVSQVSQ